MLLLPELTEKQLLRFEERILKKGSNECWLWLGRVTQDGYGEFDVGDNRYLTHRLMYFIEKKIDPADSLVCHSCDTPACCNVSHMFLGTEQDNIQDSVLKKRHSSVILLGENRPNSKLSEAQVLHIRALREEGLTYQAIADVFKINFTTVAQITKRKTWKHV